MKRWTPEEDEILIGLWIGDETGQSISEKMNKPLRSVFARIECLRGHGVELPERNRGKRRLPKPRKPKARKPKKRGGNFILGSPKIRPLTETKREAARAVHDPIWEALPESRPVSLMDSTDAHCKWPLGDPLGDDFKYCGAPVSKGSYCATHARMSGTWWTVGDAEGEAA